MGPSKIEKQRVFAMSGQFQLLKTDDGIHDLKTVINAEAISVGTSSDWSVRMQRMHGGLSEGVDVIWLDNGCSKLAILPTRGMGIWKADVAGLPLQWKSPVQRPVNPAFIDANRRGGIGWLDGFNELLCRCGMGWNGAPGTDTIKDADGNVVFEQFLPVHGQVANLPAHDVSVEVTDDGRITVTGIVDEASVFGGHLRLTSKLTTWIDSNSFEIEDTVQNLASSKAEVEMLYHCNVGRPFLEGDSKVHIAATEVAPRDVRAVEGLADWETYLEPEVGYAEQVYFSKAIADTAGRSLAVLQNSAADKAVSLRFDTNTLPYLVVWKNTQAEADGYCTGLEPATGFPNLRSVEREYGRVLNLNSEESVTFQFALSVAATTEETAALVSEVRQLQNTQPRNTHPQPKVEWGG